MQTITRKIKAITKERCRAVSLVLAKMSNGDLPFVSTNIVLWSEPQLSEHVITTTEQEVIYRSSNPIEVAAMFVEIETPEIVLDILGEEQDEIPIIVDRPAIDTYSSSKHT